MDKKILVILAIFVLLTTIGICMAADVSTTTIDNHNGTVVQKDTFFGYITFHVTDHGKPLKGASVHVTGSVSQNGETDANGEYTCWEEPLTSCSGYVTHPTTQDLRSFECAWYQDSIDINF